ncbi:MAG: right-handed parallel beta-helix repeat-containing protein [Candidatus Heimdallarchaeaceae archaeon]
MITLHQKKIVKYSGILWIIIILVLMNPLSLPFRFTYSLPEKPMTSKNLSPPLIIDSDIKFSFYGFPGKGTKQDPYIIENYFIDIDKGTGINISGTTKYFVIQNCYINAHNYGILIKNVKDNTATILDNTCVSTGFGIRIENSGYTTIKNNICYNNTGSGIYLFNCSNSKIANNSVYNNDLNGIRLEMSNNSVITSNTVMNNRQRGIKVGISHNVSILYNICNFNEDNGIEIRSSPFVIVDNNSCVGNVDSGIYLANSRNSDVKENYCDSNEGEGIFFDLRSSYSTVLENVVLRNKGHGIKVLLSQFINMSNNIFLDDGLFIYENSIESYSTFIVSNNTVNYKELGFFINVPNLLLSESKFGQLIIVNCTGNSLIRNQIINNTSIGISILFSDSIVLQNNSCNNNDIGIYLFETLYSNIRNNVCNNNSIGISVENSLFSNISSNICNNNLDGMKIYDSSHNTIQNNICLRNTRDGISLYFTSMTFIDNNSCFENDLRGIFLYSETELDMTKANQITNNFIVSNKYGIYLQNAHYSEISFNIIFNNSLYGIVVVKTSERNTIHHNVCAINNIYGSSQGYCERSNNIWYDVSTLEGNYWSNGGSSQYQLDGKARIYDPYPISQDKFEDRDKDLIQDWWERIYGLNTNYNDSMVDFDNDNLTNLEEYLFYSNPNMFDTDLDGLSDYLEIKQYGTSAIKKDTDVDRLPDKWEIESGTNPNFNDAGHDLDGDGLINLIEYLCNSLANDSDSDDDGMPDGWEYVVGLDLLRNDSYEDPDNDNLVNLYEFQYNTDPFDNDSDDDGQMDGSEVENGYDPTNPLSNERIRNRKSVISFLWWLVRSSIIIVLLSILLFFKKKEYFREKLKLIIYKFKKGLKRKE